MDKHMYNQSLRFEMFLESIRWFFVNTIMCQLPIVIMVTQGFNAVEILYSGLSYAVTLLIVANYTLEDLSMKGLRKTSVILWLLVCTVFLALYQSIKIEALNNYIHNNTMNIYLIFIGVANLMAFLSSWEQLKNNASSILSNKLSQKRADAKKTRNDLEKISRIIELKEGDM